MKIRLSKNIKRIGIVVIFIAAVALGMVLENLRDNHFVVETISDADVQTTDVPAQPSEAAQAAETPDPSDAPEAESSAPVVDGKININTADIELLDQLDGIGEKTAQKIIDFRNENNGFKSIEELMLVNGIGEKKFEAIRDKICVE